MRAKFRSRFYYQIMHNENCRVCGGEVKVLVDGVSREIVQVIRCEYCGHIQQNLLKRRVGHFGDLDDTFTLVSEAALFGDDYAEKNKRDNRARI